MSNDSHENKWEATISEVNLDDLNALNPLFNDDPHQVYNDTLTSDKHWYKAKDVDAYVCTNYDEARALLHNVDLWSDPRKAKDTTPSAMLRPPEGEEVSMLFADNPRHRTLRQLVSKAFTPKAVEQHRESCRRRANMLLDEIATEEYPSVDIVKRFCEPLPTYVIADILGVADGDVDWFHEVSLKGVNSFFNHSLSDKEREEAQDMGEQLRLYFLESIAERRNHPRDDLITEMLKANEEGAKLPDAELQNQLNLLLIAGNVTTADLIGNGIKTFIENPQQWERLCANPDLCTNAVEEMLRFCPPVMLTARIVHCPMNLSSGTEVEAGDELLFATSAIAIDDKLHPNALKFDIERDNPKHLAFGGGRHFCIGAPLARIEAQEAFRALALRFPQMASSGELPSWRQVPSFRGMARYRVSLA